MDDGGHLASKQDGDDDDDDVAADQARAAQVRADCNDLNIT